MEKHVIQLMSELAGTNTEDWFIHMSIQTEDGHKLERVMRCMYVDSDPQSTGD